MCPACKSPMIALEWQGVEIDHCPACGGTWLDPGELEAILDRSGHHLADLAGALASAARLGRSVRRCPRCRHPLEAVAAGPAPELRLERCRYGDGVWFDQGEVKALVARANEGAAAAVGRFFAELFQAELKDAEN